jgi:hypothetical protein
MESHMSVSLPAVIQRINRHLASQDQTLRKARGRADLAQWGLYYVYHRRFKTVERTNVDPEAFARELGVLAPGETVETEE